MVQNKKTVRWRLALTAQDADEKPLTAIMTPSAMKETITSPSLDSLYNARRTLRACTAAGRGVREEEEATVEEEGDRVLSCEEAIERREVTACFRQALLFVTGSVVRIAWERTNCSSRLLATQAAYLV